MISKREVVSRPKTQTETTVFEINEVLTSNKSPHKAYVVLDESGEQHVYIEGRVGEDLICQLIKNPKISEQDGRKTVNWQAEKLWFTGNRGCFFLIHSQKEV